MSTFRCLIALVSALALAAGVAGSADAASRLVVRGAGFGHGVGMSQYGALGFAKRGRDHAFILGHYYAGTQLGKLGGASSVRVPLNLACDAVRSSTRTDDAPPSLPSCVPA